MDDIKTVGAAHHEDAATQFEAAAKMHRDAAKQCANGNFEKAHDLATFAAEAETTANRHAVQAAELYRHHAEQVAERKAEHDREEAARSAKRAAKAADV